MLLLFKINSFPYAVSENLLAVRRRNRNVPCIYGVKRISYLRRNRDVVYLRNDGCCTAHKVSLAQAQPKKARSRRQKQRNLGCAFLKGMKGIFSCTGSTITCLRIAVTHALTCHRWFDYSRFGTPIDTTRILAVKTPLKKVQI